MSGFALFPSNLARSSLGDRNRVSLALSRLLPASLDRYLAALPAMSPIPVASFTGDDYFRAVAKPAKEFFAVLPSKPEFGDVRETKSANNISQKINLGLVEISIHHCALGPIYQLRLAEFA